MCDVALPTNMAVAGSESDQESGCRIWQGGGSNPFIFKVFPDDDFDSWATAND